MYPIVCDWLMLLADPIHKARPKAMGRDILIRYSY
jgi:hypothetical protein